MIKVPARGKFSRKTSGPSFRASFNGSRSNQKNRSSIMMNIQPSQSYLEPQQPSETYQSHTNTKNTIFNQSLTQTNFNPPQPKQKHKHITSLKSSQNFTSSQSNAQIHSKKFSKIDNFNSTVTKIEQNDAKNSSRRIRMSQSNAKEHARTSAIKKFSKYESPFLRSRNTRKASIFQTHNMSVTYESQQYEQFLKQPNLNQLTNIICQKVTEDDQSDKQNEEQIESKSIFQVQQQKPLRSSKGKSSKLMQKERSCSNLLRRLSSNTKKSSQKEFKTPKESRESYRQIFQRMTQKVLEQQDNVSKSQRQESKVSKCYKDQQLTSQKQKQLKRTQEKRIQNDMIYKQQTEELFRQLQREIASKQQMQKFQKMSNNYYEDLRRKLVQKYQRIWKDYRMDERERDNIGMLIDGCNLERHRRVNNFYFEKKQSTGTAGKMDGAAIGQATKDINNLNFINKGRNKTIMRPQTSRAKCSSKSKVKNSLEKSSNMLSDYITNTVGQSTQANIFSKINQTDNKISDTDSEYIFNLTNPDIKSRCNLRLSSTQRPKTAVSRQKNLRDTGASDLSAQQKQQIKQKVALTNRLQALLKICDEENEQKEDTKRKMKAFEYYCTKMDNGFEKLSQRITNYVANM